MVEVVADNGLEGDTDPQFVETAGEEEGIGVLPVRSEHLRADGDDFRNHRFSLAREIQLPQRHRGTETSRSLISRARIES